MERSSNSYVTTLPLSQADQLKKVLIDQGCEIARPPHTLFSAKKKGLTCTLYESGKLVIQGKELDAFIEFVLEPEILGHCDYTYAELKIDQTPHIGIDESGKGDFFGPLCIAGVYASGPDILKLHQLGVRDSKTMTANNIRKLSAAIRKDFAHHIVKINPAKYNELHQKFGNLNHLLAWGHATTIENLVEATGCREVTIDQFAAEHVVLTALKRKNLEVALSQRHRAEEDLVVAAASILARQMFVDSLDKLSEEYGIKLPKGASSVVIEAAKQLVRKFGTEVLPKIAKTHFKTMQAVL